MTLFLEKVEKRRCRQLFKLSGFVAHQLSASDERPRVLTGSGGRSGVAWDQAAWAALGRRLVAAFFVGRGGALSVATRGCRAGAGPGAVKDGRRGLSATEASFARPS